MSSTTWIVTTQPAVGHLVETARPLGEVVALVVGPRAVADAVAASGVDRVVWVEPAGDAPAEAYAPGAAEVVAAAAPRLVLGGTGAADRALLGAVAARTGAVALAGVHSVADRDGRLHLVRDVLGGVALEEDVADGPVALVLDGGEAVAGRPPAPVEPAAVPALGVRVVDERRAPASGVDLAAARRVVSVGRGLRAREDLALVDRLADALGAAVACSRPIAEGLGYLPKDRYVGVSGRVLAPELYVALGISGQMQHMVGARGAGAIVAVNSDPDAPIFAESDFGVVGDLYQVVPALVEALGR